MGEVHHIRPELASPSAQKFQKAMKRIARQSRFARWVFFVGIGIATGALIAHTFTSGAIWPFWVGLCIAMIGTGLMPGHGAFRAAWDESFKD